MLDIRFIRDNKDLVTQRLSIKNFKELELIELVIMLDNERKSLQTQSDTIQSKINANSKEIGQLMTTGNRNQGEQKKTEVAQLKSSLVPLIEKLGQTENELLEKILLLPNIPAESVPPGKSPEDNIVIRQSEREVQLPAWAMPHWDLAKKYNLIDFELGNKITGSGFPVYINKGARLQRALIQYFLDYNTEAGYVEFQPPIMVNEQSAFGTTQLPDKEGQMYYVNEDKFYLIPTAEVPITNIYRDEIVNQADLPIMMTAYTPCFRREAGSYGKDVRGLNRLHQFDKVELVQLTHPDKSYETLDQMVDHVEKLLQTLELPYRILKLCGGDMSFSSALTYDFEVYSAAQKKWLEVSSVSNFETFQTNRMKIRFKDGGGKMQMAHSLNGSSLALPRIVACLLENNQTEGTIQLPEVLHRYFGAGAIS
jgi:seryl-tRNA synthetase